MKNKIKTVYNLALHITSKTEYSTILSNGAWIVKSWHYTPQIEPELNVNLRFIKKRGEHFFQAIRLYLFKRVPAVIQNSYPHMEVKCQIHTQEHTQIVNIQMYLYILALP